MNLRLTILRLLALLVILPGVSILFFAITLGINLGGLAWLLTAVLVLLGCMFVAIPIRFLKRPSNGVASDILTVFSLFIYGVVFSALQKASPDAWGIPNKLGISADNTGLVGMLIALLMAWAIHRVLKKRLLEGAIPSPVVEKENESFRI